MLRPYIVFGLAFYFLSLKDNFSISPLLHLISFNTEGLAIAGALWFLTALFFTEVVFFILDKYNHKVLILPLVLFGIILERLLPYQLPWALGASFVELGLYWAGHYVAENEVIFKRVLNLKFWQIIAIGFITSIRIFENGYINMREGTYSFIPLFWINAISACFIGISISKLIVFFGTKSILNYLTSVGKNSITYVCLNQFVILVLEKAIPANNVIRNVEVFVCCMAVLHIASLVFSETKLKILIGKT